jgi:CBS domain-containing protein
MVHEVVSVRPAESIRDLAKRMTDGHLHRLPVVEEGRLVGLITSMDLVRAFADGRFVESNLAT